MSDVQPFNRGSGEALEASHSSEVDVFRPDLRDFDWAAYERRQARIDELLQKGGKELGNLLGLLSEEDPLVGVGLNNLHNTTIKGAPVRGLRASLAVLSMSRVMLDLPGVDFRGGVAPEADFRDRNLSGSSFINTVLTRTNFAGANLKGTDFTNAVLCGSDFTGADLSGTDFTGAYLIEVEGLNESQVRSMKLQAARTVLQVTGRVTSLEQLLMTRFGEAGSVDDVMKSLDPVPVAINAEIGQPIARLQAKKVLRGLYAENANWQQVDFTNSDLTGATVHHLIATQGSFRGATIGGMTMTDATAREMDLVGTWAPGVIIENTDLRDSNVTGANLVGAILREVDLRGVVGLDSDKTNTEGIVIEDCILPQGYGYDGVALQTTNKLKRELEQ